MKYIFDQFAYSNLPVNFLDELLFGNEAASVVKKDTDVFIISSAAPFENGSSGEHY